MTEITYAIVEGVEESLTTYVGQIMAVYDRVKDSNIRVVERNQLPLPGMEERRCALK